MARLNQEQWEEIKAIYAVGLDSVSDIAKRFGVSHTAINKKAKAENWQRLDRETVDKAVKSRAELNHEVSMVSEKFQVSTFHVETEIDRAAKTVVCMNRVKENMVRVAERFSNTLVLNAESAIINDVEDMKPFMAMAQLVNEAMRTPMKMVEMESKVKDDDSDTDNNDIQFVIASRATRD